jgi:23S rRNA (adenine2503-C2)-methyltransferase
MGTGEPLDNYENTVKFLRNISHPEGFHMSLRNISLSTCGLVPQILALADENLPITLSVSLHAPDDDTRQKIMPIGKIYKIRDILDACRVFINKTGRRVIFEYALIAGINDSLEQARMLADILRGLQCHVNLIPLNPVAEREYSASSKNDIHRFRKQLERMHISVTQRRELGTDINGACGQLRRKYLKAHGKI